MHLASVPPRGFTLVLASAAVVGACSLWWMNWSHSHLPPLFSADFALSSTDRGASAIEGAAHPGARNGNWFTSLFTPPHPDARQAAAARLDTAGLALDGASFLRAVATHHRPLIDLFLQAGIDVNATGADRRTALLVAALGQEWDLANHLLAAGADASRADAHGFTPLMAAAMADSTGALRSLLQHGAALEAVDEHAHTALHYAVASRSVGTVQALLAAGARADGKCGDGSDLVTHAFESGDWRIIEPVLLRQPGKVAWSSASLAALADRIAAQDAGKTRLLLSKHAGAPTPEGRAQPLLAYALATGDMAQFRFLLDCGADPNTPLNTPAEAAFLEAVPSKFLRSYLDEEPGMTVLMLAAGLGRTEAVRALLEKGASRNLGSGKYKMPAILFAAYTDSADTMQLLIDGAPKPEELRIEVSLGSQRASLIKSGAPIFSTPISSGRSGRATPTGKFVVTDKDIDHRSTIYKCPMPFFMRLNGRDFGMHEGNLPGYPASHGCIRLPESSARKLFREVPLGTLVSITH